MRHFAGTPSGGTMHYTLKDHQGSLTATVHGSTVERLCYNPWGRRRNTTDFGYADVRHTFDRDYHDIYAYVERAYEPRDLGLLQLPTDDPIVVWMEENEMHGGGGSGGFFDEKGKYLGTVANIDGKVYVIRSENTSRSMRREVMRFLKGKKSTITEETIFQYFIEIEPSQSNRQRMFEIVSQDDGTGGTSPNNNREYGGYIDNGVVIEEPPGPIKNPRDEQYNSIEIHAGYPSFHSHSSGYLIERDRTIVYDHYWIQEPSPSDIQNAGNHVHYVFGRWNNNDRVY